MRERFFWVLEGMAFGFFMSAVSVLIVWLFFGFIGAYD